MTSPVPASLGLDPDEVAAVLEAAALAPSVHNSQPWRFRVLPDRIELHADLSRRLPATDPDDKELRLACGAALANLRIALEALGIVPLIDLELRLGEGSGAVLALPLVQAAVRALRDVATFESAGVAERPEDAE